MNPTRRSLLLSAPVAALASCGAAHAGPVRVVPHYRTEPTPGGIAVQVPEWLWPHRELVDAALLEIDAAEVPPGWAVQIELPAFFMSNSGAGNSLARGATLHGCGMIHVGWRWKACETECLLPALAWEVSLARLRYEDALRRDLDGIQGVAP